MVSKYLPGERGGRGYEGVYKGPCKSYEVRQGTVVALTPIKTYAYLRSA